MRFYMVFKIRYTMKFYIFLFLLINQKYSVNCFKTCVVDEEIEEYVLSGRLPDFAKPNSYYIFYEFSPNLHNYSAVVEIDISIHKRTKMIILHSDGNPMKNIAIKQYENEEIKHSINETISQICYISSTQFLIIKLKDHIEIDTNITLSFSFKRNVSNLLRGIYESYYRNKNGTEM